MTDAPHLDNPPPALTPDEQAAARASAQTTIAALKADPKFVSKYLDGNTDARKQFADLHKTVSAPDRADEEIVEQVTFLQRYGFPGPDTDTGKELIGYMTGKATVTPELRRQVEAKKAALMQDRGFTKKYIDGDQDARRTMALVHGLLAARVARVA